MRRFPLLAALLALFISSASPVRAGLITVFNTGVNAAGTPLADGTIGDPHYTLITVPNGTTDIRVRASAGGFPIPPWVGDDAVSAWIGPNNDAAVDGGVGPFTYRTTFTLPVAATVTFTGVWSTDNEGVAILLDGVDTGNSIPDALSFMAFHPFSITGAGLAGTNTLDFVANNDGAPTGLRVEFTSANANDPGAVPEPASVLLLCTGALGLAGYWRRRVPA